MPLTYAIGDLHGRIDLLDAALAKIADHAVLPATLVTLGDYVDRGPQSRQVLERLIAGLGHDGWKLICLKGNHEDIMWQTCRKLPSPEWWIDNGGGHTLISYGHSRAGPINLRVVPDDHLDWISSLPVMYIDKRRVYVHAGVARNIPLDQQEALRDIHGNPTIIWKLYPKNDDGWHGDHHVVHGHHQHEDGPILKRGRTNLDTFAWASGRLAIGIFDDAVPGGPVDLIEVTGPKINLGPPSKAEQEAEAAARR